MERWGRSVEFAIYRVRGGTRVTLAPEVDRAFWKSCGEEIGPVQSFPSFGQAFRRVSGGIPPCLAGEGGEGVKQWERVAHSLHRRLEGRVLIWDELGGGESDDEEESLRQGVQWLVLTGRATLLPGVEATGAALRRRCNRCGAGADRILTGPCARCGGECAWCDRCVILGRNRACMPLVLVEPSGSRSGEQKVELRLPVLSLAQQDAAAKCLHWLERKEEKLLVWAVTGSGKTEMMFPAIRQVLEQGGRVLWASPRREVVTGVAQRMRRAFPGTEVAEVHGETGEIRENRPLTVATVQQTLRYYRRFRLAVVDEADAFPLQEDPRWLSGIRRSLIDGGQQVYLTATPPSSWKRRARRGKMASVTVPARFHGHPLPVPKGYRIWGLWRKLERGASIPRLESFLKGVSAEKGQAFLFVPRIADTNLVLDWVVDRMPGLKPAIGLATGRHEQRRDTIQDFMAGELQILVTTTILERGVTVPRCHVLVVGADHPVFDRATLIQVAGRVGRDPASPRGEVWFLSTVWTEAQTGAIREIRSLNRYAGERGYLSVERGAPGS
ncbi:DEAD/DEAH box helicase [Kroppenstedtia eburnea]|uniref:DEAD/DEAH box helicase n=1 Tax=Kroppenstedtia eburnea TaxID=714067 RepID=UPI00362534C6